MSGESIVLGVVLATFILVPLVRFSSKHTTVGTLVWLLVIIVMVLAWANMS